MSIPRSLSHVSWFGEANTLLGHVYFENMTTVRILHQPSFREYLLFNLRQEYAAALAAAMFSFSARFATSWDGCDDITGEETQSLHEQRRPEYFYRIANSLLHRLTRDLGEVDPPLCLLQASTLTVFYEMIHAARNVAWRSLGVCIRLAYELKLHRIDIRQIEPRRRRKPAHSTWVLEEEKRRIWWTLWGLDVFISTVNKFPLTIRDTHNATLLPVSEEAWFAGRKEQSCFLDPDPANRWKLLQSSGNVGAEAWFIVINSYTRDIQGLGHLAISPISPVIEADERQRQASKTASRLRVLANCLSCTGLVLPESLYFDGFASCAAASCESRKRMHDAHVIQAMTQLTKLYIHHLECFGEDGQRMENGSRREPLRTNDRQEWTAWRGYMSAADQVVQLVRNSHIDHIRHGHPLLSNTYWIAAAVQVLQRFYAPTPEARTAAQSNFDLLKLTLIRHRQFWETSSTYINNLSALEARLDPTVMRLEQPRQSRGDLVDGLPDRQPSTFPPVQSVDPSDATQLQNVGLPVIPEQAMQQGRLGSAETPENIFTRCSEEDAENGLGSFVDDDPGLQAYIDSVFASQWSEWGMDLIP